MVKVIIATCNRPEMLRTALQSVAAQTIHSKIGSVVVSENGGNRGSAEVCDEFTNLPINYFFRDPPIPLIEHARILFSEATTEKYTAILHDDDWWAPRHLENAYNALESNPHCSATFSNFLETPDFGYPGEITHKAWKVWAAAGCHFSTGEVELTMEQVLIASLLQASFHYSTSFGKSQIVNHAILSTLETGNAFDNDRVYPVFLAEGGHIVYSVEPSAHIRMHPLQDSMREVYQKKDCILKSETTTWMQKKWPSACDRAAKEFNQHTSGLDNATLEKILTHVHNPLRAMLIEKIGFNLPAQLELHPPPKPRKGFSWILKQFLPYGVVMVRRHLEKYLSRAS